MAYAGYLIKLGGAGGTALPLEFISAGTYDVESDRRREPNNRYDVTGKLHRTVLPHTSTSIKFSTRSISNTSLAILNGMLRTAMTNVQRREIPIEYYDPETDSYKSGNFYMPVVKYKIQKLEQNAVIYLPADFEFIPI